MAQGITATGVPAVRGIAAVDPRDVIPLGTRLFIPGYGEAIAADTGGANIGNKIDPSNGLLRRGYGVWASRRNSVRFRLNYVKILKKGTSIF